MRDKEKYKEYQKKYKLDNKEKLKEKSKQYYLNNKEKIDKYNLERYINNKHKILEQKKQYHLNNKENRKQYYLDNKEKIKEYRKQYNLNNRDKINKRNNKRKKIDPLFKLIEILRTRIYIAMKRKYWTKQNKTTEILGCDFETVKKHLENQFIDNMNWNNHGKWHIDHITPLAKATTQEELYKLCHYTNLQPLWAADNLSKGAKEL